MKTTEVNKTTSVLQKKENATKTGNQNFFGAPQHVPFFQPKLTVNTPGDVYEKEADAVAEKVMRMPVDGFFKPSPPVISRKCEACEEDEKELQRKEDTEEQPIAEKSFFESGEITTAVQRKEEEDIEEEIAVQRKCEQCEEEKKNQTKEQSIFRKSYNHHVQKKCSSCEEEEKKTIDRKEISSSSGYNTSRVEQALQSSGQPLQKDVQGFMEDRFGYDFSSVRIHNDSLAHQSSADINARAYTHQNQIVFGSGQYQPDTAGGKQLLAHELTHTIQQGATINRKVIQRNAFTSAVGSAWDATGGRVVNYASEQVDNAVEAGEEFVLQQINRLAPGLLTFLRGDIIGTLRERIVAAVDQRLGGLISHIQSQGLASILQELLANALSFLITGATNGCRAIADTANRLIQFAKHLAGPALHGLRQFLTGLHQSLSFFWDEFASPAIDFIRRNAAAAWTWITEKASWLWGLIRPFVTATGDLLQRAWNYIRRNFGIAWENTTSAFDYLKQKALDAWNAVKGYIQPIIRPLMIIGGILLMLTPAGPIVAIAVAAPHIWNALKWVAANWDSRIIGPMIRFLNTNIFPFLRQAHTAIGSAVSTAMSWIASLLNPLGAAATSLIGIIAASPLFQSIKGGINRIASGIRFAVSTAINVVRPIAARVVSVAAIVWNIARPYVELYRQLMMVMLLGPLAVLDDGVWNTINAIVRKCLTIPCLREITSLLAIPSLLRLVARFRTMMKQAWEIIKNPQPIINEIRIFIGQQLDRIAPNARSALNNFATSAGLHLQILATSYLGPMLEHIKDDWWGTIKQAVWDQLWPFEGLTTLGESEPANQKGLGKELSSLFRHVGLSLRRLVHLDFDGASENLLLAMHDVMSVVNRFYGWVALIIIASETIMGAVGGAAAGGVGAVPGAVAGFGAGLATAGTVGEIFLGATVIVDALVLLNSIRLLHPVRGALDDPQKMRENHDRYTHISEGSLMIGMMLALVLLAAIAGKIASAIATKVKSFLPKNWQALIDTYMNYLRMGMEGKVPRAGEVPEGPGTRTGEFNTDRATGERGEPPTAEALEGIQDDMARLREKVNDPDSIREVSDPNYRAEYDAEVQVGDHTFRRNRRTGRWCRFSDPLCNLETPADINAKVDETIGESPELVTEDGAAGPPRVTGPVRQGEVFLMRRGGQRMYRAEVTSVENGMVRYRFHSFDDTGAMRIDLYEGRANAGEIVRVNQAREFLMGNRPPYEEGLVENVWNRARRPDGKVYDPNPPYEELTWDPTRSRFDQWHMGHTPGNEYRRLVDRYVNGEISWQEFLGEYNNPNHYRPELPSKNLSHEFEQP
jgi:hypothetical protein